METFNSKIPEIAAEVSEERVEVALNAVALKAFKNDPHAYRRQVQYMRSFVLHYYKFYTIFTSFETNESVFEVFSSPTTNKEGETVARGSIDRNY